MILQTLDIYNVRNIEHISLAVSKGINFIYGKNGSGKSSLLEAIFILGRAKSFRSSSINKVIRIGQSEIIVSATALNSSNIHNQLGIQINSKNLNVRINGHKNSVRSDLAYALPLQFLDPKSFILLDGGASIRREFIDWGVFNLHQDFLPAWRKFKKSLAHRNALLKLKQVSQLQVWNQELVQYGTIVHEFRCQYMRQLEPVFKEIIDQFIKFELIEIKTFSGWDCDKDFLTLLNQNIEKDLRYGYTQYGPHRGDFKLLINKQLAKDYVSRGQLKLLVVALKIAQIKLLFMHNQISSCLLIDDLTSELDLESRTKLIAFLSEINTQVFITATDKNSFGDLSALSNYQMFHVQQGKIMTI